MCLSGSVLEPYQVTLGKCIDIPCDLGRGSLVDIEVEFNPKGNARDENIKKVFKAIKWSNYQFF